MLTFKQVKQIVQQYAGTGGSCAPDTVNLFARSVLEYLLFHSENGSLRRFDLLALKGCFAAPEELETPITVRINGHSGGYWNKHFSFYQQSHLIGQEAVNVLEEMVNYTPVAYPVPEGGSFLGVMGTSTEKEGAEVCVIGTDATGRDIMTSYKGETIRGEIFSIKKDIISYGKAHFAKVVSVKKPPTFGYVSLWAVNPNTREKKFLSDYSPLTEVPQYKQFRITAKNCSAVAEVSILGKIRLKEKYTDNDVVPFESTVAIEFAAQALYAERNFSTQDAQHKNASLQSFVEKEADYKRGGGSHPSVLHVTSPGRIRNIVPSFCGVVRGRR